MTQLTAGILFDASLQQNALFQGLMTFVAFNTLVYLGLTGSKLVRWFQPRNGEPVTAEGSGPRHRAPAIAPVIPPHNVFSSVEVRTPGDTVSPTQALPPGPGQSPAPGHAQGHTQGHTPGQAQGHRPSQDPGPEDGDDAGARGR